MTIATAKNTPRNTYTASAGQTNFTIGFEFFAVADVKAYKNGTLLTYNASPSTNSQYSLVGTASSSDDAYEFGGGGTLKLGGGGASANDIIVIIRDIAITRTSDFSSTGTLDVKSINTQLDQLTAIVGDLKGQTDRSVKLLDTDTAAATVTLPAKATRQDKLLSFDSNGNLETTTSSSGLAVSAASAGNNSVFYTLPELMEGVSLFASYNPQVAGTTEAEMGYGITYTGIEGLTASYASTDEETGTANTSGEQTAYKISYAYGPVTIGMSNSDYDVGSAGTDQEIDSYNKEVQKIYQALEKSRSKRTWFLMQNGFVFGPTSLPDKFEDDKILISYGGDTKWVRFVDAVNEHQFSVDEPPVLPAQN